MPAQSADPPSGDLGKSPCIIPLPEKPDEDEDWARSSLQQFLRSYSDEDAIYDEYDKHRTG